ncbi:MAG: hypothetical protein R3232_07645 [Clostridia bacterium]|nr:hypothetical protein [Clostridia bacterium]
MAGIKLDFKEDGKAAVAEPENKLPVCLGKIGCKYFVERNVKISGDMKYSEWFCKKVKRPVFEILDDMKKCPLSYWYTAGAYDNGAKLEASNVQTIVAGFGNDGSGCENERDHSAVGDG